VAGRPGHVPGGRAGERLVVRIGELPDHPSGHTGEQDACWNTGTGPDNAARGHQGAGPDLRLAEHDGADPDQRAGLHVSSVYGRVVT
jgi:hypothetical protein